jgi:hypothetical protein
VKCWGANAAGQLGDGTNIIDSNVPVNVSGLGSGVATVSAGWVYTCAVTTVGSAKCWGNNFFGQLGDGTVLNSNVPVNVSGLGGVAAVSAGGSHTCALTTGGGVKCWGWNDFGQLGDGNEPTASGTPVDVSGLGSGVAVLSAGFIHTCGLTTGSDVKCWGDNASGQLGDGNEPAASDTPVDVDKNPPPRLPHPGDTDGDGCSDQDESRPKNEANQGGGRDYLDPWDFYDVRGPGGGLPDQFIDLPNDILGVVFEYAPGGYISGTTDHTGNTIVDDYDRGQSTGPNPWNMTAPDGVIDLSNDILGVVLQYQHDCT